MKGASSGMTIAVILVAGIERMSVEMKKDVFQEWCSLLISFENLYETCSSYLTLEKWKVSFKQNNLNS